MASSYNGKPSSDNGFSTVPAWEKKFCASVGSVPWEKLIEGKNNMFIYSNVANWEDSAVKEAFDNAKNRFWAEINGFPCDIPLPDPDMHIDDVDWDASSDPELYLELDRVEEARRNMKEKRKENEILGNSFLLNQASGSGRGPGPSAWEGKKVIKSFEPHLAGWGWGIKDDNSRRWIPKEQYGGDLDGKHQARNDEKRNWESCEGCKRGRENNDDEMNGGGKRRN
ncbi:uncharacterized protein LOC131629830 [Vicia villosa]|uniref:uncharacterized protein LOC131629830 n=1 Tax=Vicia villosa TaxID=3911 RepID=UPI00273C789D|nr:uncharacterized protein LOC131629830 [Vicia villosa]